MLRWSMTALFLPLALLAMDAPDTTQAWPDTVQLAGKDFPVPEWWRGHRLGHLEDPRPRDLRRLPSILCEKGSPIYLREDAWEYFITMAFKAYRDGVYLVVNSGYRSSHTQTKIVEKRLAQGRSFRSIARSVAPPGYSEHMLGTTIDLSLGGNYKSNPTYQWLKAHGEDFGFTESYTEASGSGIVWEPWHWRWRRPEKNPPDLLP